jgi:sugar/nucleoside kinase (ribokinase family)
MVDLPRYLSLKGNMNGVELVDYLSPEDYAYIARILLSMGTKMVALKSAHRGFYFMTGDAQRMIGFDRSVVLDLENWAGREIWCPAYHAKCIATTTGAGDSSIAGFLSAFLRGHSLEKTLKLANCVGYRNLHAPDALSGIEDWPTTVLRVESDDMEINDPRVDTPGWRWDSISKVMIGPNDKSYL